MSWLKGLLHPSKKLTRIQFYKNILLYIASTTIAYFLIAFVLSLIYSFDQFNEYAIIRILPDSTNIPLTMDVILKYFLTFVFSLIFSTSQVMRLNDAGYDGRIAWIPAIVLYAFTIQKICNVDASDFITIEVAQQI